ncbi:MAG: cell division protein FtsX [Parabacteroides sp.]|nr:cell division protein FtsX [Parabacteroides sp.]
MIKHLVKIIWNQRRRNGWIAAEILLVFVVLWYIIDSLMAVGKVFFAPMGWDIDHVYWISMGVEEVDRNEMDSTYRYVTSGRSMLTAIDRIKTCPGVEAVGVGLMSMPYVGENSYMLVGVSDSVNIEYVKLERVTPGFMEVFGFRPMEGERKSWEEMLSGNQVILSGRSFDEFKEKGGKREQGVFFGDDMRVIGGVTASFRADRFQRGASWLFRRLTDEEIAEDDTDFHVKIAVRVNPSADHDFPEFFLRQMEKQLSIDRLYLLDVIPYSDLRYSMELRNGVKSELQNQIAVMGFLLFNIFLGIIGTFWFRTEQRKGEMGLRIALGSTRFGLKGIMIAEGILLLTLVAIPASIICVNLQVSEITKSYYMDYTLGRFLIGFAMTYLIMAIMVVLGIWYPVSQLARLEPAEALRYE